MTALELADHYANKREFKDAASRAIFCQAFVYGWNQRHDKEPHKVASSWPTEYRAGFETGWHAKEKVLMQ